MATKTASAHRRRAAPARRGAPASSGSRVYVYCIVESPSVPRIPRAGGVPDSKRTRAVPLGPSRWLVLADVPRDRFGEAAVAVGLHDLDWTGACALAHDSLIVQLMKSGPVVPMPLFTIFEDEDRAVAQARAAEARITRTLQKVAGCAE